MSNELPVSTRLRYVKGRSPDDLVQYLDGLGVRVQIYGSPVWDGKAWFLWYVPNDRGADVPSVDLTIL